MAPSFDTLRVRLLQIRHLPHIEKDEQESFLDRCQLRRDQLLCTNMLYEPITEHLLDDVDAVLIGGAGAHSVTQRYAWTDDLVQLVERIDDREIPLFGSCWGHQFLGFAYGGTVILDSERAEIGCGWVRLTHAGTIDPLFCDFPVNFRANMGHHDRISVLPTMAEELATNDIAPYQAIRIRNKLIYGTQFHTELDAEGERRRLIAYHHLYPEIGGEAGFQRIIDSLAETTEVDGLLNLFLRRFAVAKAQVDAREIS